MTIPHPVVMIRREQSEGSAVSSWLPSAGRRNGRLDLREKVFRRRKIDASRINRHVSYVFDNQFISKSAFQDGLICLRGFFHS